MINYKLPIDQWKTHKHFRSLSTSRVERQRFIARVLDKNNQSEIMIRSSWKNAKKKTTKCEEEEDGEEEKQIRSQTIDSSWLQH